ncbi:MAG TPA: hypothetical protein VIZ43_27170, partial [Trebonia sp.]
RPPHNQDHTERIPVSPGSQRRHPAAGGSGPGEPGGPTARRRAFRRDPTYPAFIAPDGTPCDAANVLTANGWCVDTDRLRATVRHFAPHARFTDLSGFGCAADSGGPLGFAVEFLAGLAELIGWRRLGWLLGVAAAAAVMAVAATALGTEGYGVRGR